MQLIILSFLEKKGRVHFSNFRNLASGDHFVNTYKPDIPWYTRYGTTCNSAGMNTVYFD